MPEILVHHPDDEHFINTELIPNATCLDRARVALEGSGQVYCAAEMRKIQDCIRHIADLMSIDGSRAGSNILVDCIVHMHAVLLLAHPRETEE